MKVSIPDPKPITFTEFMDSLPRFQKMKCFEGDELIFYFIIHTMPVPVRSKKKRIQKKWLTRCRKIFDFWMTK